jgi:hypothetical protein
MTSPSNPNKWNLIAGRAIDVAVFICLTFLLYGFFSTYAPKFTGFSAMILGVLAAALKVHLAILSQTGRIKRALGLPAISWSFQKS